jgi:prolyl-tRNA editing enzyme YbaK/EbsC (Cys-tRNA(Pro) deacylase)
MAEIEVLERHVTNLEAIVFDKRVVIPDPPFPPEDQLNPALVKVAEDLKLTGFCGARRVPSDYYEKEFEYRRQCLQAQSIDQLCKCVLFEIKDCPDPIRKYVCVIVQYIDKIGQRKLLDICSKIVGRKVTDVSLAKENDAVKLSGCKYNAMTPVLMKPAKGFEKYKMKVVLSERIAALNPQFFWLGGGEVDVKFGIQTVKFVEKFDPIIYDISE